MFDDKRSSECAFQPWRWWSKDTKDTKDTGSTLPLKPSDRHTPSLMVAKLNLAAAEVTKFTFTPLKESSRRHYAQRLEGGTRLGTLGSSAKEGGKGSGSVGAHPSDVVIARWTHSSGRYTVQLFDVYGGELADCRISPVGTSSPGETWEVVVMSLNHEPVTEAQSADLLDGGLYSAFAAGVKHGETLPIVQTAQTAQTAQTVESIGGGLGVPGEVPDVARLKITASDEEAIQKERPVSKPYEANDESIRKLRPSDRWCMVVPAHSPFASLHAFRDFRRMKWPSEKADVPIIWNPNSANHTDKQDVQWLSSPYGMSIECFHTEEGGFIGAIFPIVGEPATHKGICVTRMVVSEYPTASTVTWKPSIFRVWLYRTGYEQPVGTMLVIPNKESYFSVAEPGTSWISTDLLRNFFKFEDTSDYAVDSVNPSEHIIGRLAETPQVDPNLAATLEMAMWELRYRRSGAMVKVLSAIASEG